ncbi:ribokinase [Flammeovirgaceae bacterium 311]|nr:ribokinase [Flammeovirgaceae bacterium 311]
MKRGKIIVIGSTNMDMVVKTSHIPVPGETVLGGSFFMNPGGKGANQAVAVARLGGAATFITKVGNDIFGKQSTQLFDEEGVDTVGLLSDNKNPSGVALITVDAFGENSIVVASGANANLTPTDVERVIGKVFTNAEIMLVQLEIPMETVKFAVEYAAAQGIKVILNPAPANTLVSELFRYIDIITPNTNEAEMLTGIAVTDMLTAKQAAESLHEQGVKNVVITLGKMGAGLLQGGKFYAVPAPIVEAVDTTAAGDVFNGALAVAIAEGKELVNAVYFACQASSMTVTRMGAQSSIPYRNELILQSFPSLVPIN